MASSLIQFTLGPLIMERISKWRVKEGYPSEKSDDTFIRAMFIEQLDKVIPITP
jgi:hypothetical protein